MKKVLLIVLSAALVSGCIRFNTATRDLTAGVFLTNDFGETWEQKNLLLYSGGVGTIAGVNVREMSYDPSDSRAIYATTAGSGILYSFDNAQSWQQARGVPNTSIDDIAVNPKDKCEVYVTLANTIIKSTDCNRSWSETYIDTRMERRITALAVDWFYDNAVYAGDAAGDILKSTDSGNTWQVIRRLGFPIAEIIVDPFDYNIVYVVTTTNGIFKSYDAGASFVEINEGLRQYTGAFEFKEIHFSKTKKDSILLATRYGLLKSNDGGIVWEPIQLITQIATANITAVAVDPTDENRMYYTTETTFYQTNDGGATWQTKRLPSNSIPTSMLINPNAPHQLLIGMTQPQQ